MPDSFMRQWELLFRKANADLKLATYALAIEDNELDMEIVFFHLQQAAEKYLKALLSFNGIHFEKVHDIQRLIDVCITNSIELPAYTGSFVELNPFAVEGRYALIADDMADARKYIDLLNDLKDYVGRILTPGFGK